MLNFKCPNMKIKIIILCFCFLSLRTFCQNLKINFTQKYLNENSYGLIDGKTPFLIIKIENSTKKDIYFKNPFPSISEELPNFTPVTLHSYPVKKNITKKKEISNAYLNQVFYIKIGNKFGFDFLEVFENEILEEEEEEKENWSNSINDDLFYIYKSIQFQKILNKNSINRQLPLFYKKNDTNYISLKELKTKLRFNEFYSFSKKMSFDENNSFEIKSNEDIFYFLKNGESVEIKVNLVGFKLLGGTYNIILGFDKFDNFICYRNRKIMLPEKYNDFFLYQGQVESNTLKIKW